MSATTTSGASLTREQVQSILVQPLQTASAFLSIPGLRIYDTDGSPVRLPKLTGSDAATFVAEGAEIPLKDVTFSEVTLLPSTMKGAKVISQFSNELARSAVISLDVAIRDRMVTQVAAAIDTAMFSGTAVNEPQGLLTVGTANVAGTAVGSPTVDDLYVAVAAALEADVQEANLRWIINPRDMVTLHKQKASTGGQYLLQPDPSQPGRSTLLGYPVTVTKRVPIVGGESKIVLFDPTQVAVARDLNPQVTLLSERYADYDMQAVRVVARYDMALLNPASVVTLTGVTA